MTDEISKIMKKHYQKSFRKYGPTFAGVDWGKNADKTNLRYQKMLEIILPGKKAQRPSLLDVGCGYGGLYEYTQKKKIDLDYTGVDLVPNMIKWAKKHLSKTKFIEGDFLKLNIKKYDYIVCNGILTQKLTVSLLDMDEYAKVLIQKMFKHCNYGIAFNMMSTSVNFFAPNLYYKHPAEILTYCLLDVTKKIKIDHSYNLYEFSVYLFK